jgi:hypothetical protein
LSKRKLDSGKKDIKVLTRRSVFIVTEKEDLTSTSASHFFIPSQRFIRSLFGYSSLISLYDHIMVIMKANLQMAMVITCMLKSAVMTVCYETAHTTNSSSRSYLNTL